MVSPLHLLAAVLCVTLTAIADVSAQPKPTASLRIIAINDFHGHLEPGDNAVQVPDPADRKKTSLLRSGGAAYLAARIQQLRAEPPSSIVISAGDLIGASPLVSGLFLDEPTIEAMNAIGLDLNAVGNHEFDRGAGELLRIIGGGCRVDKVVDKLSCASSTARYSGARFPFIAANVLDRNGKPLLAPAVVREVDGIKVGFIGAVTRSTPGIVQPDGVTGLRFTSESQAINATAKALQQQSVQAIVAIIHEGGEADGGFNACDNPRGAIFEIERELDPAIDVVFSAHTHRGYNCLINGRTVIQAASYGRLLAVVDLELDRASGDVIATRTRARNMPVPNGLTTDERLRAAYPALAPDPEVDAIVAHYRDRAAPIASRTAGRIAERFDRNASAGGDQALGRLIADAQLAATRGQGAVVAFTNPGGIRTDLRPRPDGSVSHADLYAAQPFGNVLVTLTLTGAQLRELLEQQWNPRRPERARMLQPSLGLTYAWDPKRPVGARIVPDSLRLDGARVEPDRRYRVTVNDFLAAGGDGFFVLRDAGDRVGGPLDLEALTQYVRLESASRPLVPDRKARIQRAG